MGLMIVPKILRLHDQATDTTTSTTSAGDTAPSKNTSSGSTPGDGSKKNKSEKETKELKSVIPSFQKKSTVKVTPVKQFTANQ
ncbi:hypothetical protein Gpo141_00013532 [Globisporangium polare]